MFVKGGKSADECEEHFYTFYNRGKEDYLPKEEDFIIMQRFAPSSAATSQRNNMSSQGAEDLGSDFFELDQDK